LRAALEFAANTDPVRINNRDIWRAALRSPEGTVNARRCILPDADVVRLIGSAYGVDHQLGILVEILAQTGARLSQVRRLQGADLKLDPPRLHMPSSKKGGRHKSSKPRAAWVPIPEQLAKRLAGRPADMPLLIKTDGMAWGQYQGDHRALFREAVERAGLDLEAVGTYALRHSSIVRALLCNVPVRIVAALHDTGIAMLERHYSFWITDFTDDIARPALLSAPAIVLSQVPAAELPHVESALATEQNPAIESVRRSVKG
jgi:integrase